jgi:hypothetical protein
MRKCQYAHPISLSEEAEHPLLLRLRVIRIDLAGTADHGTTDHIEEFIAGQQIEEGLMFLEQI